MRIKFLIKEANRYKKETGLSYKSTKIIKLAADISDIIQSGGKVFMRFSDHPKLEMNYQFNFYNPVGIYAYNFPPQATSNDQIIKILEAVNSGDVDKMEEITGNKFALDKNYLIFFTYPSKNLWTIAATDNKDYEDEENEEESQDNLAEPDYARLLDKLYHLCKDKIKKWAAYEGSDTLNFYERIIDYILNNDEKYYEGRKTLDHAIYRIVFWFARNWDNNFFKDFNDDDYYERRRKTTFRWSILLRKLGIDGISDNGMSFLGWNQQAILLRPEKCRTVGVLNWGALRQKFKEKKKAEEIPTIHALFSQNYARERMETYKKTMLIGSYFFDDYDVTLPSDLKINILENSITHASDLKRALLALAGRNILQDLFIKFDFIKDAPFILENIDLITKFFNVFLTSQTDREEFFQSISRYVRHPDNTGKFYAILPYVYYNKHINKSLFAEYLKKINFNVRTDRDKLLLYQQIALNCVGAGEGALELAKKAAQSNKIRVGVANRKQLDILKQFLIKIINYRF